MHNKMPDLLVKCFKIPSAKVAFWVFFILLLMSFMARNSILYAAEINLTRSQVIQLALHLEVAEPELRYDFIQIALTEMYNSYHNEWQKSLQNLPQDAKKKAKVNGWRYATQSYLESLEQFILLMDSELPLDFFISAQNKLIVLIGQQPVIITGPNTGANKQIEKNIVEKFCQLYDCRVYFTETPTLNKRAGESIQIPTVDALSGSWSIKANMQAEYITSNKMVFNFTTIKNRREKEQWAITLAKEVISLLAVLKTAREKGNHIEWTSVKIEDLPLTDKANRITINNQGDFIKVALPVLGTHKQLFEQLVPWIKSHFDKHEISRIIVNKADDYFKS